MTTPRGAPVVAVSVVISTLDRPEPLGRCLDAVLRGSRLPAEVVVVDQGNAPATEAVLRARRGAGVPLVHVTQPRTGLSASQNAGVRRARCPVVSIVDDDCVPDRRWVEIAAGCHARAGRPLLLGGRVLALPPEGERTVALALRTSTERALLGPEAMPWDVGTGGNFSVTRAAYLDVGGNDERLGTGTAGRAGNDLDLFRRLVQAGVEARYEPELLVRHERATAREYRRRCWSYGFGIGASVAAWLARGDRGAWRVLGAWVVMRARLLAAARGPRALADEVRVLLGTGHGLWYGRRLHPEPSGRTGPP